MVDQERMTMSDVSDYVISRLRKESGLWYDLNEGVWEQQYANQAHITDGASFLLLWFSSSQPQYDNWIQIDQDMGPLFVAWQNRHDSRREFDESFIHHVTASAIAESPSQFDGSCSLLSFQLTGSSPIEPFQNVVVDLFPTGRFRVMPTYAGKLCDSSDFAMSPDPYTKWFQLDFESPITGSTLINAMSHLIEGGNVTLESNKSYESSAPLRKVGVDRLEVFGRK